ncbi:MAG: hypothetical protein V5804_08715 [Mucilaginibacter sp.]|uniref:hypothetical protein n=1 Tax=Mucilaginibacter sp. TaxID=1882438 RepID=UPI0034E39699
MKKSPEVGKTESPKDRKLSGERKNPIITISPPAPRSFSRSPLPIKPHRIYTGKRSITKDEYDYLLLPKKISFAFIKENNHERSRK